MKKDIPCEDRISIGKYPVDADTPVFFIAEAGVNHNGDLSLAQEMIRTAKKAGADCIKFQTFHAEEIVTATAPKAAYQLKATNPKESQLAMLKSLELSETAFLKLKKTCDNEGILFLSTPYSYRDVDLLDRIGAEAFKIASGQLSEYPFLDYVARKKKPIILSTGMSTFDEVEEAVSTIQKTGLRDLVVLQCTTNYPSTDEDCHLRVMDDFATRLNVWTGYSDHTIGPLAILAAVAMGARVIEKHFTHDRRMPGPDHACSMEPDEMQALIRDIRRIEKMRGELVKKVTSVEKINAKGMKRSLVANCTIPAGAEIKTQMLTFKRPASGIPPKDLARVVGRKARVEIAPDTVLLEEMLQ